MIPLVKYALAATTVVTVLAACGGAGDDKPAAADPKAPAAKKTDKATPAAKPAITVTAIAPQTEKWPQTISANGNIAAWQEASVGAEVAGLRLTEVLVNIGDRVRSGQVLARLAETGVQTDLARERAAIAEADAMLADARANAERARALDQTGAISAQQIQQLLTAERTAEARLAAARARLAAEQLRLDHTRVIAPDDGIVILRPAMIGGVLQPGQELFRIIRKGRLEWRAEVTAAELGRIKPGQRVAVEAANGAKVQGVARSIAPTVDPQTRNAIVYVDLPAADAVRAGMFARGEFALGETAALTLPQASVLRREGFDYVFVLEGAGNPARVKQVKVDVGRRAGERIEVLGGLAPGVRAVATGVGFLNDGDTVRVEAP